MIVSSHESGRVSTRASLWVLCTICILVLGLGYLSAALLPAEAPVDAKRQALAAQEKIANDPEPVLLAQVTPAAGLSPKSAESGIVIVPVKDESRPVAEEATPLPRSVPATEPEAVPQVLTTIATPEGGSCVSVVRSAEELRASELSAPVEINSILAAPGNDDCGNAITLTQGTSCTNTAGTSAEATQSIAPITCATFTSTGSLDVWYKFVATTTNPTIQVVGGGTFDSVVDLRSGACNGVNVSCADATTGGGTETINATGLTIGNTYLFRVYGWAGTTGTFNTCVFGTPAPVNDRCTGALPLTLDIPFAGSNVGATADYTLTGTLATCYTADGELTQTASAPAGRDTVYSFTAPTAGLYSFKAVNAAAGGNMAIYTNTTCPAPGAITCAPTVRAANRNSSTGAFTAAEEVMCKSMTAGETRFIFVDEITNTTTGGAYVVEVNRCTRETEANGTTATANALACPIEGSIGAAADVDFYTLGTFPAGTRVFTLADGVAASGTGSGLDVDMRVTTATDTLEYDDFNNSGPWGNFSSNIAGRALTAAPAFIRMNHNSATATGEPYRLYALTQPPGGGLGGSSATAETEPNGTSLVVANSAANNYFSGAISTGGASGDLDLYAFGANAGDLITLNIDGDPLRDLTPADFAVFLFDTVGNQLVGFTDTDDQTSSNTSGAGSLTATSPKSAGEAATWRARYSGTYYAGVNTQTVSVIGDYLYSIGINCQNGTTLTSDVSVTKSGPPTATAGSNVAYTITVNNAGPNAANKVVWTDTFPTGTTFVNLTGPTGWTCSLVAGGVSCTDLGLGAGVPQVFTLTLAIPQCFGNNDAFNNVSVTSLTTDVDPANNSANVTTTVSDPGTCSDGNACTTGDTCVGTTCQGGPPPACDDGDACTGNVCNPGTGLCENPPILCNDNNPCTDDSCDPQSGCLYGNDDTNTCSDNDACTQTDACVAGECVGSNPVICDDGNVCTTNVCNTSTGLCSFANNTNVCDDGSACTTGDVCGPRLAQSFDGVTAPALPAGWTSSQTGTGSLWVTSAASSDAAPNSALGADGATVSDEVLVSPAIAIVSNAAKLTFRTRWSFESATTCFDAGVLEISINGGAFTDIVTAGGSFASGGYTGTVSSGFSNPLGGRPAWCLASTGYPAYLTVTVNLPAAAQGQSIVLRWRIGTDTSTGAAGQNVDSIVITDPGFANSCNGTAVNCDDSDACTADSCNPQSGCVHTPIVCNDNNVCTDDSCNPASGCVYTPNDEACDDGSACTEGDVCSGGVCQPGGALICNDNNVCTDDSCNPSSGCVYTPNTAPCDDGDACTTGDICSDGSCQPGGALICNDNNVCTDDSCDPQSGCVYSPNTAPCDDGDACTTGDTCGGGSCQPGGALICNDNNVCTDDSCDPQSGCVYSPNTAPCDDGDACTVGDVCGGGSCQPGGALICNDNNVCTDDSCDPQSGCVYTPNNASCDDGDACTVGDVCGGGSCQPGGALNCNDNNPCTDDSCLAATGCHYENNTDPCTDGDACTVGDVCGGGSCQPGGALNCNDNNPCTDDSCLAATGCHYENNTDPCSDGDACTVGDVCGGGSCQPGGALNCNDNNPCTDDSCLAATGCHYENNTDPCDDGDACTTGDVCGDGTCHAGAPVICNDNDACTADGCSPILGCQYVPIVCNDNDACTADSCNPLLGCQYAAIVCNDGNVCTDDSCNPASGCVYDPNTAACDDGNACTTGDTCAGGSCAGTPVVVPEVTGVVIGPGTVISWTPVPGVVYDVAYGTTNDLQVNGTVNATCLVNDLGPATYAHAAPNPASGDGYFYLIRAQNSCGDGGYGYDSGGAPRLPTSACP